MKRRVRSNDFDESINMDTMMDNMTDVVGTLLLVLIIVQLKVGTTVDKIESSLPKVTAGQVAALRDEAASTTTQLAALEADWTKRTAEQKPNLDRNTAQTALLRRLETEAQAQRVTLLDLETLQKQLAEKRKLAAERKSAMAALIDEREKLKALLDRTPAPPPPGPAKIVRMPAAREVAADADLHRVLLAGGKAYVVNQPELHRAALAAFSTTKHTLIHTKGQPQPGRDTNLYDHEKTAAFLTSRRITDRTFDITFPVVKTLPYVQIVAKPKPGTGETSPQFASLTSQLQGLLRSLRGKPKSVVWFLVHFDSIETYLAARDAAERAGIPSGWDMWGAPYFIDHLYEFQVNQIEQPTAPLAPQIAIPLPKRTVD